jgi:hypothetical protein
MKFSQNTKKQYYKHIMKPLLEVVEPLIIISRRRLMCVSVGTNVVAAVRLAVAVGVHLLRAAIAMTRHAVARCRLKQNTNRIKPLKRSRFNILDQ